jgi:hypothetical protein
MHKMVLVLGSADCVLRCSRLSCGLFSDQRGQTGKRADRNTGHCSRSLQVQIRDDACSVQIKKKELAKL